MPKRYLFPAVAVFCLLVFWGGVALHFPGAAFSRYVEHQVNRDPRYLLKLSPADFNGFYLSIATAELTLGDGKDIQSVTFHESSIPVSLGLMSGLTFSSLLGDSGIVEGHLPWGEGEGSLDVEGVPLAALPLKEWVGDSPMEGRVTIHAAWRKEGEAPGGALTGEITGQGEAWRIAELKVQGATMPDTRLDKVELLAKLGKVIQVEQLKIVGDAQGTVSGTVTPNWNQMDRSSLQLNVNLTVRPEWIRKWGALAPLLESFIVNGRLGGQLRGTLARPAFTPSKRG